LVTTIAGTTVAIWVYLIAFRGGFWRFWHPPVASRESPPRAVVAVVPARDEAGVIERSIASLLAQELPGSLHIVLVDDQSSDRTAELAAATAASLGGSDRLTICSGKPIPTAWTGKLWALQQGITIASSFRPDYLLLTDADIVHAAGNVGELVALSESDGYDLVSLMVKLNCSSFWEHLLVPAFVFFFFKLYPPRWVADPSRRTSAAAGGCILIRPSVLEQIGGIASIQNEIIDDCALARRVKSVGKVWLGTTEHTRSIREYPSWRPIGTMIARCAFAQTGNSGAILFITLILLMLTYIAPMLVMASADPVGRLLGATAWLVMSATFLPTVRAYGSPRIVAFLLPLISIFYAATTVVSAVAYWRGRGSYWKGRFQANQRDQSGRPPLSQSIGGR
jgi:hopene-associated glycosyltransferase HpnB